MFLIEKYTGPAGGRAQYAPQTAHLWTVAWPGKRARLGDMSVDQAIATFFEQTTRVKHVPHRLRPVGQSLTLAAIHTVDAEQFEKYRIFAVGFYPLANGQASSIHACSGQMVPGTAGIVVGGCMHPLSQVRTIVESLANALAQAVASHDILIRYNSDGRSGGAWLMTSATDGILSNADVGITYRAADDTLQLHVSHKYLNDPTWGNRRCAFTGNMDYLARVPLSIDGAVLHLRQLCATPTPDELRLLQLR